MKGAKPGCASHHRVARLVTLLAPLHSVSDTPILGRDVELARLAMYVDGPVEQRFRPLVIRDTYTCRELQLLDVNQIVSVHPTRNRML